MSDSLEQLRDGCKTAVDVAASGYVITVLSTVATPIPQRSRIDEITTTPKISFTGVAFDQQRLTRAAIHVDEELSVQIVVQQKIPESSTGGLDMSHVDDLTQLVRQIASTVRSVTYETFRWVRNDSQRDPFNLPMTYEIIREENVFQAIFNAVYKGVN